MIPSAWDIATETLNEDWYILRVLQNAPRLNLTAVTCDYGSREMASLLICFAKGPWVPLKQLLLGWKISSLESNDIMIVPGMGLRWGRLFHRPDVAYLSLPCQWKLWDKVELLKLMIIIIVVVI